MENKIRPFSVSSSHSGFFSSLKQVEKRLKLEQSASVESQKEGSKASCLSCSPMFLHVDEPSSNQNFPSQDSSEAPPAFLSVSQEPPHPSQTSTSGHTAPLSEAHDGDDEEDEIERLMKLLGLSDEQRDGFDDDNDGGCCHCEDGFYAKIVGVEGPKCRKEVRRLDGWINHFLNGEEKKEPLRLAHLLLGKAAFISQGVDDGGFGGLHFPSTIQEFLHTDPPRIPRVGSWWLHNK